MDDLEHGLTHVTINDAMGERLTPACRCGWYSPAGSHSAYERHIAKTAEPCGLCSGEGCEHGCGRCESAHLGPNSHRVCRSCGGSGRA